MTASFLQHVRAASRAVKSAPINLRSLLILIVVFAGGYDRTALGNSFNPEQLSLKSSPELLPPLPANPEELPPVVHRYFALNRLKTVVQEFATALHVPYVWGGNKLGDEAVCQECTECIIKKKLGPKTRTANCPSCARCGIDCSHLVQQVFSAAGLEMPYAASSIMANAHPATLLRHYNLVDIGTDFEQARPGDIIVYRRHVGILMANHGNQHGDLVHASRFAREGRERVGGIRYDIHRNIVRPRGGMVRILRHRLLMAPNEPLSIAPSRPNILMASAIHSHEIIR